MPVAAQAFEPGVKYETIEGSLLIRWGTPASGSGEPPTFQVVIRTPYGAQIPIDANAALLMTHGSLFDLYGAEVLARVAVDETQVEGHRLLFLKATDPNYVPPLAEARGWVNLLCKFPDVSAEPQDVAYFDFMFSESPGHIGEFWRSQSDGLVDVSTSRTLGWYTLARPRGFYIAESPRLDQLFADCVAAARDGLETLDGEQIAGVNLMFNASLGCCAWGGNAWGTVAGVERAWPVSWNPPTAYGNQAGVAHEMGHALGFPHSNNSDHDSSTYDNPWDLMSDLYGYSVADPCHGASPKNLAGVHLLRAGWLDYSETYTVSEASRILTELRWLDGKDPGTKLFQVRPVGWLSTRYYTIEARRRSGDFDGALPGTAVLIYEVDMQRAQPAWLVDADVPAADHSSNAGVAFTTGESWTAPSNVFSITVGASTDAGFLVEVQLPAPLFRDGFEDRNSGTVMPLSKSAGHLGNLQVSPRPRPISCAPG